MSRFRSRRDRERGAVAVEAALITPLFLLFIFGMIELSLLARDWLAVNTAVRAGARIASAQPRLINALPLTDPAAVPAGPSWQGAQSAVDQLARESSALPRAGVAELWVYKAGLDGRPVGFGDFSGCDATSCVKFAWNEAAQRFLRSSGDWAPGSQNACVTSDANPSGPDAVGVYLRYRHDAVFNLIPADLTLNEFAVMNLEPYVSTTDSCKP